MSKRQAYPGETPDQAVEFAPGHVSTPPSDEALMLSRRGLLGAMAATMALAGAEGCRRPIEKVVPYGKMPEDVIPGVPTHYATVMQRRGEALGLVVESHEGRPTKIEGNESHPSSMGAADLIAQASVLDLYDPERSTAPRKAGQSASWVAFEAELAARLGTYDRDQDQGARLRILMQPTLSPTVLRMRAALAQRFPKARVHTWAAVNDSNPREGSRLAYGQPLVATYLYERPRVILSLDSDFLQTETGSVRAGKTFAAGRRLRTARDQMSRLYVVEPSRTTTGANADHRLRLPACEIEGYLYALAAELAKRGLPLGDLQAPLAKRPLPEGVPSKWLNAVASELVAPGARGHVLIVVGSRQPPVVHALAHALNAALGSVGTSVTFAHPADPDELDAAADMKALTDAMGAGQVDALVILGGNPVYDAPADLAFGEKLAKVPFTVHASIGFDETGERCSWHVPRLHELEAWGDAQSIDGTVAVQQPLIEPLFGGRSDIEMLALMANASERRSREIVIETARGLIFEVLRLTGCGPFNDSGNADCRDAAGNPAVAHRYEVERQWGRALATGVVHRPQGPVQGLSVRQAEVAAAIEKRPSAVHPGPGSLEVTFAPCPKMFDGRHANNTWLQEMPDPETKLVWDNAAIISPATAKELGLQSRDMITLAVGQRSARVAVWVLPGQADRSVALTLGWGRRKVGRIGDGRGFDVYPLRASDALGFAVGAQVQKSAEEAYFFAQTQEHDSAENRPIAHQATLAFYRQKPNFPDLDSPPLRALPLWGQADYSKGHQWGMSVDLNACTGCSACVIACMAENNVPVVGKKEVWRGREMHWLRIDRYYTDRADLGGTAEDPVVVHEPVMCVHCEEAPCENVCPVNATTHGPEGLNEMAYNRCIGTRYCANNCPYKVRRFNYLNWHNDSVWKETGGLPESVQMQQNPNVTVRFRGVMEKCTYCVQRIQSEKIRAKRDLRELRDGQIRTACQQTCPTDAIVFGDLNDLNSAASKLARLDRRFGLLAELGTRPRTTYLGKVRNLNPEMA